MNDPIREAPGPAGWGSSMSTLLSEDVAAIKAALAAGPTPGPWFADFKIWTGGPVLSDGGCFQILDNENENQANVLCSRHPWDERADEMRANARLFAACNPERMARLIDALENAAAPREPARPDEIKISGWVDKAMDLSAECESFWSASWQHDAARAALREHLTGKP